MNKQKYTYIKADFLGYQVWRKGKFALYNLLEPLGEHPIGSTVSKNTIQMHGAVPVVDGKVCYF